MEPGIMLGSIAAHLLVKGIAGAIAEMASEDAGEDD